MCLDNVSSSTFERVHVFIVCHVCITALSQRNSGGEDYVFGDVTRAVGYSLFQTAGNWFNSRNSKKESALNEKNASLIADENLKAERAKREMLKAQVKIDISVKYNN